jgi:hypothetical protein
METKVCGAYEKRIISETGVCKPIPTFGDVEIPQQLLEQDVYVHFSTKEQMEAQFGE